MTSIEYGGMMYLRRVFGWFDSDVYISSLDREFMLDRLSEEEYRHLGSLDPRTEKGRNVLADLIYERLSFFAAIEPRERKDLRVWLNVLGAAVVKIAESEEYPSLHVPGTQDDPRRGLYLYMCTGTLGERILLEDGYPYLCYPTDWPGEDLRRAFKALFGNRIVPHAGKSNVTDDPEDVMLYVVLDVPNAAEFICPCRGTVPYKKYGQCHGLQVSSSE